MKADYFEDLSVPTVPATSPPNRGRRKPCNDGHVPTVPTAPTSSNAGLPELAKLPLAAKLRAYGHPWPLVVDGEVKCWLVPDDQAARADEFDEAVYTAAEAEYLATLPADDVQRLHDLKASLGGTIRPDIEDET